MTYGEEMATGVVCRECLVPLEGDAPGHTRLCTEYYGDEMAYDGLVEPWETIPAAPQGAEGE